MREGWLCGFGPDADRAAALDHRVRGGLADSLNEIAEAIGPRVGFALADAAPLLETIRRGPVSPGVFAIYTELVEAALRDDAEAASGCARALPPALRPPPRRLRAVTLLDHDLGAGQAARYRRLISDGSDISLPMDAVDTTEAARATGLIAAAVALLDAGAPAIASELRVAVAQIVLIHSAAPAGDSEALVFDGASSFYLWGAVFINSRRQKSRVEMAVALVHEAAHGLLFGMSLGAPLVENDPAERYDSPLRYDKRPMDGLVHATYVLARMIDCLQRLIASRALTDEEQSWAQNALASQRRDFAAGLATVTASARFTPVGYAAFSAMREAICIEA